jgi:8-amino-7-oxononanoate synthase
METDKLKTIEFPVGAEIVLDGRRYINFGGSSYLGLSANPQVVEAGVAALRESGCGYQFHRSYGIATRGHQEAESEAATFFNTEAALYLAAGYYFGLVSIAVLREEFSTLFYDEWAHSSLREAIAASGLPNYAFRHLDVEDLKAKLRKHMRAGEKPLIITDGLYSTFGEIAPLGALEQVMMPYGGRLLVDESHSFGVLGKLGRGAVEHHNIPASSVVIGGSTGKALGVVGGIVPASAREVAAFRSASAGRGAAAGLPAAASMCARSLRYVRAHPELLERLRENVYCVKSGMRKIGLEVGDNAAPVAAFAAGTEKSMNAVQERLMSEGIFVFRSTYIGAGATGVMRFGIFADHTTEHIGRLLDALRRLL